MDALQAFLALLTDANWTQEEKSASAPLSTTQRNLTANRVLQSAVLIAGAGMLAFADDPLTFESTEKAIAKKILEHLGLPVEPARGAVRVTITTAGPSGTLGARSGHGVDRGCRLRGAAKAPPERALRAGARARRETRGAPRFA